MSFGDSQQSCGMVELMYEGGVQTEQNVWLWGLENTQCSSCINDLDEFFVTRHL